MSYGCEKINVLCKIAARQTQNDKFIPVAHTRGRSVLKSSASKEEIFETGSEYKISDMKQSMELGTQDMISDLKLLKLWDNSVSLENIRKGKRIYSEEDDDEEDDEEGEELNNDYERHEDDSDEDEQSCKYMKYTTPDGKTLHIKTAETFYLNGGKRTLGSKNRASRFFIKTWDNEILYHRNKCCPSAIELGTICRFKRKITKKESKKKRKRADEVVVDGKLLSVSKMNDFNTRASDEPMQYFCEKCDTESNVTFWVCFNGMPTRCHKFCKVLNR